MLTGRVESPEDRFRVVDNVTEAVRGVAGQSGLVVILDDIHVGDEPSLLVLRHLAEQIADAKLLVFAAFRDVEPAMVLARVLPDLLRSPRVERLDLHGFGLAEVREQLSEMAVEEADARTVLDVTGGNPLFVREVARAMAERTWRPDRPRVPCSRSSVPGLIVSPPAAAGWCRRRPSWGVTSRSRSWRLRWTNPPRGAFRSSMTRSRTACSTGSVTTVATGSPTR